MVIVPSMLSAKLDRPLLMKRLEIDRGVPDLRPRLIPVPLPQKSVLTRE
jgi:hypothetical protein